DNLILPIASLISKKLPISTPISALALLTISLGEANIIHKSEAQIQKKNFNQLENPKIDLEISVPNTGFNYEITEHDEHDTNYSDHHTETTNYQEPAKVELKHVATDTNIITNQANVEDRAPKVDKALNPEITQNQNSNNNGLNFDKNTIKSILKVILDSKETSPSLRMYLQDIQFVSYENGVLRLSVSTSMALNRVTNKKNLQYFTSNVNDYINNHGQQKLEILFELNYKPESIFEVEEAAHTPISTQVSNQFEKEPAIEDKIDASLPKTADVEEIDEKVSQKKDDKKGEIFYEYYKFNKSQDPKSNLVPVFSGEISKNSIENNAELKEEQSDSEVENMPFDDLMSEFDFE
ncbi:MAG: hypothetical protein ACRCXZ_09510, partial [Patescibacteria group bacterium]